MLCFHMNRTCLKKAMCVVQNKNLLGRTSATILFETQRIRKRASTDSALVYEFINAQKGRKIGCIPRTEGRTLWMKTPCTTRLTLQAIK